MATYVSDSGSVLVLSEDTAQWKGAGADELVTLVLTRAKFFPPGNHFMTTENGEAIRATTSIAEYRGENYNRVANNGG